MRELATGRAATLLQQAAVATAVTDAKRRRNVYTADHSTRLPGKLVTSEHKARGTDVEVNEAYDGSGTTYDSKRKIAKSKRSTDRTLRALQQDMEHENTLVQDSPNTRLQKVLKIYRGIKPVIIITGGLPLIPSTWRAADAGSAHHGLDT
jgi:hypothetical protein